MPFRYIAFALCLTLALLVLGACAPAGAPSNSTTPPSPLVKTKDGLTITLKYDPAPLKTGTPTRLTITILDAQNHPVDDATITMKLDMLGMKMEKNEPKVEPAGNGTYVATATFTMGGNTWIIDLHISRPGQATDVIFSDLDVHD